MDSESGILATTLENFFSLPVCWPRLAMFHGFDTVFSLVFEMRVAMNSKSCKLSILRDHLLPRLLSGQVRSGA